MLKHELEQHLGIKVTDEFYTYINARYMEGDFKDQTDFKNKFLGDCKRLNDSDDDIPIKLKDPEDTANELTFSPFAFHEFKEHIWLPFLRLKHSKINNIKYPNYESEDHEIITTPHSEKIPFRIRINTLENFYFLVNTIETEGDYTDYQYFFFEHLFIDFDDTSLISNNISQFNGAYFKNCTFKGHIPNFFQCTLEECNFKNATGETQSISWCNIIIIERKDKHNKVENLGYRNNWLYQDNTIFLNENNYNRLEKYCQNYLIELKTSLLFLDSNKEDCKIPNIL